MTALAELLYTIWKADGALEWHELYPDDQAQWEKLAAFVSNQELRTMAELARERCRRRVEERLTRIKERAGLAAPSLLQLIPQKPEE